MRAVRGWEGNGEPRGGFHYANSRAGFISACAPGLRGWEGMPGFRGQPKAGPHPCQLSFLFLIHSARSHGPLPPDRRTCISAQPAGRPRSPRGDPRSVNGKSATGAGEVLLVQENTLCPKPPSEGAYPTQNRGITRKGKRTLQESFIPTEKPRPIL